MSVIIEEDKIYIPKDPDCEKCGDKIIMHRDVTIYEHSCADVVAEDGGNILEVGFGLGVSADRIQTHNPNKHVIIEIDEDIYNKAIEWAEGKDNVEIILGDWKDVIDSINDKFDGVYNDADYDSNEDLVAFTSLIQPNCNENCKLIQTNWGVKNDTYLNAKSSITIDLDENSKKWLGGETLDIVYVTLLNDKWA